MEFLPTLDEIAEEIVTALKSPDYDKEFGVDLGDGLQVYGGGKWVEMKLQNNIVQREFGEFSEEDEVLLKTGDRKLKKYIKTHTLPTIEKAVKACIFRIFQLEEEGVTGYLDTRML